MRLLAFAALLAGCHASLGGDSTHSTGVDGGTGSSDDVSADAAVASPDAPPACANGRKVYLHFTGNLTLTAAATSDAPTNQARWLTNASAAIPPWRQNVANRVGEISQVVAGVKDRLAGTPIEVVTSRPAAAPYVMIVFGGARANDGGTVGTVYSYSTSFHDCGDMVKSDVGWVSDMPNESTSLVADIAVGAIGWGLGLDGTTVPTDCMCGWANGCQSDAGACTLSSSIATSITNGIETACQSGIQDEVAAFTTGFCAP